MNDDTPKGVSPIAIPLPRSVKDIRGQRFGRWLVESYAGSNKYRQSTWLCVCSCTDKNRKVVGIVSLQNGKSKSCGCLYAETRQSSAMTHGLSSDPIYQCHKGIMSRCYDKGHVSYPEYGGRGVTVHLPWHDVKQFKKDMPPRPTPDHTVDRFPNRRGNYEPGNVRWATHTQQQRNMKSNVYITFEGQTRCLQEWSEIKGWHRSKIKNRRYAGWSDEEILGTP